MSIDRDSIIRCASLESLRLPIDLHLGRPEDEVSQHVSTNADELQAKMRYGESA